MRDSFLKEGKITKINAFIQTRMPLASYKNLGGQDVHTAPVTFSTFPAKYSSSILEDIFLNPAMGV